MSEQSAHQQQNNYTNQKSNYYLKGDFIMKSIDKAVLAYYNNGCEYNRLRTGIGLIEFERTKEILLENLPKPPAVIYDIGGGYGEYSWWLASMGYEVHLFDLSETNIKMSKGLSSEYPNCKLYSSEVCDARSVTRVDKSADAILLMGPLYHITDYKGRISAIKECRRLLKHNGILFSAALTPYSVLIDKIPVYDPYGENKNTIIENDNFIKMVERELSDGCHINPDKSVYSGLGTSHLHTAKALKEELSIGGFSTSTVHGIMGGAWLAPNIDELWKNESSKNALMRTVRLLDTHEEIMGLSGHLLAISRKDS